MHSSFYSTLFLWSFLWIVILNISPGSKNVETAYRLNFIHGFISTMLSIIFLFTPYELSEYIVTSCTISYLGVDMINNFLNDFIWKVQSSYHNNTNRRMEYFHHLFGVTVGIYAEYQYANICTYEHNPLIIFILAECSTPFLIAWRKTGSLFLGGIFVILFISCRILYHGIYKVPELIEKCPRTLGITLGSLYNIMNIIFLYFIFSKVIRSIRKASKDKKE